MGKKIFLKKAIIFVVICAVLIHILTPIFIPVWEPSTATVEGFYGEDDNSIDVLFLGTSRTYFSAAPWTLWNEYGITAYSLAIEAQPIIATYYLLTEALKTQNPKVIAMEVQGLDRKRNYDEMEIPLRESFDRTPLSINKLKYVMQICQNSKKQKVMEYLFPFFRFHNRWDELKENDFLSQNMSNTKGGFISFAREKSPSFPDEYPKSNNEEYRLTTETEQWFKKIIELCEKNDIKILLYAVPNYLWSKEQTKYYMELTEHHNNICFLNFNDYEAMRKINFDINHDYADEGGEHINYYGANKIMHSIGYFMKNTLHLPDHRGDPSYNSWQECSDYVAFMEQNNKLSNAESLSDCLPYFTDSRYTIALVTCDDGTIAIDSEDEIKLSKIGLSTSFVDGFRKPFICLIDGGKVFYERMNYKDYMDEYSTEIDGRVWKIVSIGCNDEIPIFASVNIGDDSYRAIGWGLMIVIYDKMNEKIVMAKIFGADVSKVIHEEKVTE